MKPYGVELSPASVRAFKKLPPDVRSRIRRSLVKLGADGARPGRIGGKTVKSIQGAADSFYRLRVGDYRVMFDVIEAERVILVLWIVDRGDLERWLRNR